MRITKLHDQLVSIGEEAKVEELVAIILNEFSPSWQPFVCGVCAWEKNPTFEKIREDFIQEERRLESVASMEERKNISLISKMKDNKKGLEKGKKGKKEDSSSSNQGKKDLSHVKCVEC